MSTSSATALKEFKHQSQKAVALGCDVFVWWAGTNISEVMISFNSNSMFPISAKTLVRWANMIRPISLSPDSAEIWKAKTKPGSLTSYRCELTESAIDPNSVLVQGDYAYHDPTCSPEIRRRPDPLMTSYMPNHVFQSIQDHIDSKTSESQGDGISKELREQALALHQGKCIVTGEIVEDVYWIFPPAMVEHIRTTPFVTLQEFGLTGVRFAQITPQHFQVVENLIPLKAELYELMYAHALAIDVDDDYRVFVFDKDRVGNTYLPSHLRELSKVTGMDKFFREHLRWCITHHLVGEDASKTYSYEDYLKCANKLGWGRDPLDVEPAMLGDERWGSEPVAEKVMQDLIADELLK